MEVTFYDKVGRPNCYREDGVHLFSFRGRPLAFFAGGSVFSFGGRHLGWLDNGTVRDSRGDCVLFSPDAQGGPTKPLCYPCPAKSARSAMFVKSARSAAPASPALSLNWSKLAADDFFR